MKFINDNPEVTGAIFFTIAALILIMKYGYDKPKL